MTLSMKYPFSRQEEMRELSKAVDSYMRFRAEREGVGYDLSPDFFEEYIRAGVGSFFGVTFARGKLLADAQQPAIFSLWNILCGTKH